MRRIKVKYRKLGKEKAVGLAHCGDSCIEVDVRLKGKKQLEVIIHESLHILFPHAEEEEIEKKSTLLTNLLWNEKFRKIDDDNTHPLQDGTL